MKFHPHTFITMLLATQCIHTATALASSRWGVSVNAFASHTRQDTSWSHSIDHQYLCNTSGQPFSTLSYALSARFRDLQVNSKNQPLIHQSEWQPAATLHLKTNQLDWRSDYQLRAVDEAQGSNNIHGKTVSTFLQTRSTQWPELSGRYLWNKNVSDLELLGVDTRQRNASAAARLQKSFYALAYQFADQSTKNLHSQIDRVSQIQDGRADVSIGRISSRANAQLSYQVADRVERERHDESGATLIPIIPVSGLAVVDPSPEFGALNSEPGLVDGAISGPEIIELNLSSGDIHNIGLEFAAAVSVDQLHLYTDTLFTDAISWSIWSSQDNLNWQQEQAAQIYPYDLAFKRFEFSFSELHARYIKIVQTPWLGPNPVFVTELRALISRTESQSPLHSQDHRAAASLNFVPAKWLTAHFTTDIQQISSTLSTFGRQQIGFSGDMRSKTSEALELIAQYRGSSSRFDQDHEPEAVTHQAGLTLISKWAEPLRHRWSVQRREEYLNRPLNRRVDNARMQTDAVLFPELRATAELSLSHDMRPESGENFRTRSARISTISSPYKFCELQLDFQTTRQTAEVQHVPSYSNIWGGHTNIRVSPSLYLSGDVSRTDESHSWYAAYDANIGYTMTQKISFSGSVNWTEGYQNDTNSQWTIQSTWRPSIRWDVTAAHSQSGLSRQSRTVSSRLGLSARL